MEYLRQLLEEKTPPAQVAAGADHHMCQWSILEGKHHQLKVQRSGPASGQIRAGCSNCSCNNKHHTTGQIRTSMGAVGVPDAAINATCVRACRGNMVSPHASCIDCAGGVYSSSSWRKYSTCTCGGHHPLQLALVVFFLPTTGANTLLALVQLALCGGGCMWWWYM